MGQKADVVVKDLSVGFGAVKVLSGLNINVAPSEFIVLLGPSGCGKSTLLNAIAGLLDIKDGQIHIGGRNVTWEEPKDRGIAMVFQSYALYPRMSVRENMSFGLKVAGTPQAEIDARVAEAAQMLRLTELLDRKPAALSGGQRQRVAIGRALVRKVGVYLLDEPLSNLDAQLRAELRVEIKRLHARFGSTMIYVTHDQIEALTLADRIAVMQGGVIQQLDTPQAIYRRRRTGSWRPSLARRHELFERTDRGWCIARLRHRRPAHRARRLRFQVCAGFQSCRARHPAGACAGRRYGKRTGSHGRDGRADGGGHARLVAALRRLGLLLPRRRGDEGEGLGTGCPFRFRPTPFPFSTPPAATAFDPPSRRLPMKPGDRLSFQLYSARFLEPLSAQFELLASLGYRLVEPFGGLFSDVDGLRRLLDKHGMTAPTAHVGLDRMRADAKATVKLCKSLGIQTVLAPAPPPGEREGDEAHWRRLGPNSPASAR